jgi:PAS domain S-box-containing protein
VTTPASSTVHVVRILLLEDNPADAQLIRNLLAEGGLAAAIDQVDRPADFAAACERGGYDVILSDFQVPGFDGWSALGMARRLRPEVPFIFVSGVIGEEMAVESLREGAADYVLKARLARLVPAIRRVLAGRDAQVGMRRAELALRERLFEGIAEANRLLLTATRAAEALPAVLRALGEASGADRALVVEFDPRAIRSTDEGAVRAEWTREPRFSVYHGSSVAAGGAVASSLALPVVVAVRQWGQIVFQQVEQAREWTGSERAALGTVAANIGQAFAREQALDALAESERRYDALLAGLSEGVFQIDLEARWRFLNPTWEELTGYPAAECLGRRFAEFLPEEEAAAALEGFGRLLSGRNDRIEAEIRFRHRRGHDVWLRVIAQTQLDENKSVIGVSGTLVDVTQRRQAQEALRASERKFAAVFASASDALFLVATETNLIVECNPRAAEMFECGEARELVGTNVAALQRRPLPPEEQAEGQRRLARGEVWARELEYVARRGRIFWGQKAVVRMAPEALGTTLVRVTDITELKRSEERLRASLADKEVLLKEVYHRVKNNLQIISALLRMQARRVKDSTALEALENSVSRVMAMSMVHEKLYQAQNLLSIDFLSFAQSLISFLNQLTIGSRADVVIELEGEPLALSIDQAIPLGLVLNELVTNSLKYAFPESRGGRVRVHVATESPTTARVVVADDGVGLASGVTMENSPGLGFRIVSMLVEQLQGVLEFKSNRGLQVTVRLPLPAERPAVAPST